MRVPIPLQFRKMTRLGCGDTVDVELELDLAPRPVVLPVELRAVLEDDPEINELYEQLPPSMQRAWATYVAEAKRPETRMRRVSKALDGIRAGVFP